MYCRFSSNSNSQRFSLVIEKERRSAKTKKEKSDLARVIVIIEDLTITEKKKVFVLFLSSLTELFAVMCASLTQSRLAMGSRSNLK